MKSRLLESLGSLRITVTGLLLLLVLTVWGTLYQVHHGLYEAQERFYQSWAFLAGGFLPFPGAQLVMVVLFANLTAAMLVRCLGRERRVGMLVTHLGLMLMLAAGAVTFYFGQSAHLSLAEGETSNVAMAYSDWEFAVLPDATGSQRQVSAFDAEALRPGRILALPGPGLSIRIGEFHRHCEAGREASGTSTPVNASGFVTLNPLPRRQEPSENLPGIVFTLLEDGRESERHLLWGGDPGPTRLRTASARLEVVLRRQRLPLPAAIQLVDFRRDMHPGSGMAKSYSSLVLVRSGKDLDRKVLISMNKPLRLGGFTFYQSSFSTSPGGREVSTLAVVRNHGRLVPYVATGATAAGMLLHFTGMLIARLRRRPERGGPA